MKSARSEFSVFRAPIANRPRSWGGDKKMSIQNALSRRLFLGSTLSLVPVAAPFVLGCGRSAASPIATRSADAASSSSAPLRCAVGVATEPSIEGPYYRDGAPFRANLVDGDVVGAPLVVSGNVVSLDCKTPLSGAVVDVWQANGNGQYDNDGSMRLPDGVMRLRGKLRSDPRGGFAFNTVLPGHYLNGRRYRPAHIHVKVSAPGHESLTTQLYFPDDPYNDGDPFMHRSLIMDMSRVRGALAGHYDFVLRPLARGA
jgi:catechol 1,2-dioxygenase